MQLSNLVEHFVQTHNSYDSKAFTDCFTDTAIVHDEGKTHEGKKAIQQWIEHSNDHYRSLMKPLQYEESGSVAVLSAKVSGKFLGSPIILKFHLTLKDNLIDALRVTE